MKKFLLVFFMIISTQLISYGAGKHHVAAFMGATSGLYTEGHTNITLGLDYEYMIYHNSPKIGIGLTAEMVLADNSETILALPLTIHTRYGVKFYVAPALLMYSEDEEPLSDPWGSSEVTNKSSNEWFVRFGLGYEYHIQHFTLSPTVSVDLIAGKTYLVYGLSFGYSF